MAFDNDDHKDGVSRRHALERMIWASSGVLWTVSGDGLKSVGQISSAQAGHRHGAGEGNDSDNRER
jgi:hypothetical protein